MRTVLNLIWLVLSGFWLALLYGLLGLLLCVTIVLIPVGLQLFKLALFALWPFGRQAVRSPNHTGLSTIGNILWLIPGLVLVVGHVVTAFACAITIIGIPLAYANLKLVPMALTPFGREVVRSSEISAALAAHRAG
jgi:uncharacterized membrane protein YccF (DUF307 family)